MPPVHLPVLDNWRDRALGESATGLPVATSTLAGGFYCEHVYFHALRWATAAGSPAGRDAAGDPMVGFLHLPGDACCGPEGDPGLGRPRALADLGALVGRALAAWLTQLHRSSPAGELRGLLTGFAAWGSVADNPSGAFVRQRRLLDASLRALGAEVSRAPAPRTTRSYRMPAPFGGRTFVLATRVLPVSDRAIDGGRWSIQRALASFAPHFALSLGVAARRRGFSVELCASDQGLDEGGGQHSDGAAARTILADNPALARALWGGTDGNG